MSTAEQRGKQVAVIGAGIIGVCSALYLTRAGYKVTLIDRQGPGEGASFGNGAVISPSSVIPVATPGLVWKVPGMLLDPLGPLRVRWGYLPRAAPWLLRFVAASRKARVEEIAAALGALNQGAVEAYGPLTEMAGATDMIRRAGWVCVYETEAEYRGALPMLELERRLGVNAEVLGPEELRQLEPSLASIFARSVFYPDVAHTVNNFRLVQVLAEALVGHGGRLLQEEVHGFEPGERGPRAVVTDQGRHDCDAVVIAAGAWSRALAAQLGSRPPLDTERGYHLTVGEPGVLPRLPIYSTTRGIVCAPQEQGLRIAGTVELGGLEAPPDWRRAEVLMANARRWFPALEENGVTRWMGFRPSMPDSLPVISVSPRHPNVVFAFGHGHSGLGLGARTGQLVNDLVTGRAPEIDMAPYRVDRF